MNRRITKTMAEEAASNMKKKAYSKKIEKAYEKLNAAGEELVRKYIPAPVIACVNEYSTYFGYSTGASITAIKEHPDGWTSRESNIPVKLSFKIPGNSTYITVEAKEYETVRKLHAKAKQLEKERDEFGEQVYDALVALKTEKNVEKELPEAMKYLVFPEVKAVPMPVFTGLRDIIGKIKDE
jgi:hypothetical protein